MKKGRQSLNLPLFRMFIYEEYVDEKNVQKIFAIYQ